MFQDLLDDFKNLESENKMLLSEIDHLNKALALKDETIGELELEIDYLYDIQTQDVEQITKAKEEIKKLKNTVKAYEEYLYNQ